MTLRNQYAKVPSHNRNGYAHSTADASKSQQAAEKVDQRFVDRIDSLKSALEAQKRKIGTKEQALQSTGFSITPKSVDVFASAMHERLHGKNPQFRKAYVHHFIQEIVVEKDRATLKGSKLAIMAAASMKDQSKMVPTFEQEWCTSKEKLRTHYLKH